MSKIKRNVNKNNYLNKPEKDKHSGKLGYIFLLKMLCSLLFLWWGLFYF